MHCVTGEEKLDRRSAIRAEILALHYLTHLDATAGPPCMQPSLSECPALMLIDCWLMVEKGYFFMQLKREKIQTREGVINERAESGKAYQSVPNCVERMGKYRENDEVG